MLRTVERIQGLPRNTLTQAEQKQLKESNILVDRTANAAEAPSRVKKPWGIENPDHGEDRPSLWLMPQIKTPGHPLRPVQSGTGDYQTYQADVGQDGPLTPEHPIQEYKKADGTTGRGAHIPTVQRWITNSEGKQ